MATYITKNNDDKHLEDRLRKRLKKMGFYVSKSATITPGKRYRRLKRDVPLDRGYRITELATGAIVAGQHYDLQLFDVEIFWRKQLDLRVKSKRDKEKAERIAQRRTEIDMLMEMEKNGC